MEIGKHKKCSYEGCSLPHRRNGYCANHSQKFKRGTLYTEKITKLCSVDNCDKKHYCKNLCNAHYRKEKRKKISTFVENTRTNYEKGDINFTYKHHENWARALKKCFGNKCMLCGWKEDSCDAHHIVPKREGGLNNLKNGIVLCPNHHKLADIGKLKKEYLSEIINNKIQSLLEELKGN